MDRRHEHRFVDGSETDVRRLTRTACIGRIVDVSTDGVRLWTDQPLQDGEHVSCRVQFERHSTDLPLRVVWSRRDDEGWTCGAVYDPLISVGPRLIDSYRLYVLHRRDRALTDLWAS